MSKDNGKGANQGKSNKDRVNEAKSKQERDKNEPGPGTKSK